MTLRDAGLGQSVTIKALNAQGPDRRRLMDLGFVPGSVVDVLRRSPLGDPIAYRVRGATIALRGEEAKRIVIE